MTQMHRDLNRRPWEGEVGKPIRMSRERPVGTEQMRIEDVSEVNEKMSQEAKVVPEAQRCFLGFGFPQVQSGSGMQKQISFQILQS